MDCYNKNLKIKSTLLLCLTIVTLLTIIIGVSWISYIRNINDAYNRLYEEGVVVARYATDIETGFWQVRAKLRELIIESDPAKMRAIRQEIDDAITKTRESAKKLEAAAVSTLERKALAAEASKAMERYIGNMNLCIEPAIANRQEEAWRALTNGVLSEAGSDFNRAIVGFNGLMLQIAEEIVDANNVRAARSTRTAIIIMVIAVIASLVLGSIMVKELRVRLGGKNC